MGPRVFWRLIHIEAMEVDSVSWSDLHERLQYLSKLAEVAKVPHEAPAKLTPARLSALERRRNSFRIGMRIHLTSTDITVRFNDRSTTSTKRWRNCPSKSAGYQPHTIFEENTAPHWHVCSGHLALWWVWLAIFWAWARFWCQASVFGLLGRLLYIRGADSCWQSAVFLELCSKAILSRM